MSDTTGAGHQLGIPNLQILEPIGGGGFARVYRAYDHLLRRQLAVKILRPVAGVEMRQAFEAEAAAHGPLSRHPGIVTIHQAGFTTGDDRPYLVMDYIEGGSLGDYLADHGTVPWPHVVAWLIPICDAVHHAHGLNILHRDIKPDNILLDPPGTPLLGDFGIACLADETSPLPALSLGHAAPEALRGERRDVRSDVYSLGTTMFQLLSGFTPYGSDVFRRLGSIDTPPPHLPPEIDAPPWLDDLVRRAMAPDPADRPASAAELGRRLQAGGAGARIEVPTVAARPLTARPSILDTRPRHPSMVPGAGGPISVVTSRSTILPGTTGTGTAGSVTAAPGLRPGSDADVEARIATLGTLRLPAARPRARHRASALALVVLVVAMGVATWTVLAQLGSRLPAADGGGASLPAEHTTEATTSGTAEAGAADPTVRPTDPAPTSATDGPAPSTTVSPTSKATTASTRTPSSSEPSTASSSTSSKPSTTAGPGTVPAVIGMAEADAKAAVRAAGFPVAASTYTTSCTAPTGTVITLTPRAGATVPANQLAQSPVTLTVSKGAPAAVAVPNVVGATRASAASTLSTAGYRVTTTTVTVTDPARADRVTAQSPPAGATASACDPVVLTVTVLVTTTTEGSTTSVTDPPTTASSTTTTTASTTTTTRPTTTTTTTKPTTTTTRPTTTTTASTTTTTRPTTTTTASTTTGAASAG